jgi:hypothetical protein
MNTNMTVVNHITRYMTVGSHITPFHYYIKSHNSVYNYVKSHDPYSVTRGSHILIDKFIAEKNGLTRRERTSPSDLPEYDTVCTVCRAAFMREASAILSVL